MADGVMNNSLTGASVTSLAFFLRYFIHTFLSHPPFRAPLRTAVGTCHGAPRVAPWYALLVSLTLGRID